MVTVAPLTYEDYIKLPDDERYELIDGELIMAPSPTMPHQASQSKLGISLGVFVREHNLGMVFFSPCDVVLSESDVIQPDLMFISNERENIITHANIQGAPDLVVEILSPPTARRDWGVKRELYARHGVKEFWVIDASNKIVWLMILTNGRLDIDQICYEGDNITSRVLEGFSLAIDDIF